MTGREKEKRRKKRREIKERRRKEKQRKKNLWCKKCGCKIIKVRVGEGFGAGEKLICKCKPIFTTSSRGWAS